MRGAMAPAHEALARLPARPRPGVAATQVESMGFSCYIPGSSGGRHDDRRAPAWARGERVKAAIPLAAALLASSAALSPVELPGAAGGIGFDDLVFSRELHRIIAPAGRTGRLDLVDPSNGQVVSIEGFSRTDSPARGHAQGTTSADAGQGLIFATDRGTRELVAVDPAARRI